MSKRGLSLGVKLAMTTVAALAFVSWFVFHELTTRARNNFIGSSRQAAELMSDLFAVTAVAPLDFGDDEDVQNTLENLRVNPGITYAAVWRPGSRAPAATIGQAGNAPLPRLDGVVRSEGRIIGESLEVVRSIQRADGTPLGAVLIRFSLASVLSELKVERRGVLLGTLGTALLVGLLILGFARYQIVVPLDRLVTAARQLEQGKQRVRVDIGSHDEMGRLASAFNTMSAAIVDREQRLAIAMGRLRELFDNMRQGIIVFGPDGRVDEAPSKQAAVLFGADVAGRPVQDVFYGDAMEGSAVRQAFEEWLSLAFEVPVDAWSEFATLAPLSVQRTQDKALQWLELSFTPVVHEGRIQRIMVLASDVTGQRRLERATQTLEEQHARQMGVMRRLVAGGGQVFASFLESTDARLASALRRAKGPLTPELLAEMFRVVHTTRAEARTFELPDLASECQGLERLLREIRDGAEPIDLRYKAALVTRFERSVSAVKAARELFIQASPIGNAVLDQMTVRKSDVHTLSQQLASAGQSVQRALANLTSRPFGECVAGVEAAGPRWATEVGKEAAITVQGREARVPEKVAGTLTSMLPHIVRNAIAHGIETPSARELAGKPRAGSIQLSAREGEHSLIIEVRDDGNGLDEAALLERGRRIGIHGKKASELLFASGVSTAVTVSELAGQGMGLAAVREGLCEVGADICAHTELGRGAYFEITVPWTTESASPKVNTA